MKAREAEFERLLEVEKAKPSDTEIRERAVDEKIRMLEYRASEEVASLFW